MNYIQDPEEDQASYRNIWKLSWPQVVMMFFHVTIGITDVWVAGQIHEDVQAALGPISQSVFLFLVVAMAFANGGIAAISQSVGAGLQRRVQRYVGLMLLIGIVGGMVLLVVAFPLKMLFLQALQIPGRILPQAEYLLHVFLLLLPAYYLFVITNAIFRAQQKVLIPLGAMAVVASVNVFGDLGFGLGWWGLPEYGYKGVAWATFFSISAGMVYNIVKLRSINLLSMQCFAPFRWNRRAFPYLIRVAAPAAGMQLLWNLGYMVLYAITGALPFDNINALAGMTAGMRLESFFFLPAYAFNMTASILVGNFLGAGKKQEAKRVGWRLLRIGCGLMTVIAIGMWPFIGTLASLITPEPAVMTQALHYLVFNIISIPFTVTSMILGGIMTGAGATLFTFVVFSAATWLVRLPVAYVLGHIVWKDAQGIYLAMLISQVFQSSVMLYLFQYRDWYRFSMVSRNGKTSIISPVEGTKANVRSQI